MKGSSWTGVQDLAREVEFLRLIIVLVLADEQIDPVIPVCLTPFVNVRDIRRGDLPRMPGERNQAILRDEAVLICDGILTLFVVDENRKRLRLCIVEIAAFVVGLGAVEFIRNTDEYVSIMLSYRDM